MASSLLSNTNQVFFDSVLAMDNAGMVAMFEALVASGLKGLATLQSEELYAKEERVLTWVETDSVLIAIQRRGFIIAKNRELLLRKFLVVRRSNFVSGTPTSAIDLKVLDLLTAAHHFALKELLRKIREQKLQSMDEDTQLSLPPPVDQIPLPSTVLQLFQNHLPNSGPLFLGCLLITRRILGGWVILRAKFCPKSIIEKALLDALYQKDQAFRGLIKSVCQEAQNQADVFSIKLEAARAQNACLLTDLADTRKEVKDQKAEIFKEMDERLATIRNDLLDFREQAQENHLNLSTQLGFLVDYINRGGDAKKGESGSSRPQPPPDDQSRPSGGSGSSSRRRDDRSGSKRHSSSGVCGPYKRDAEYWIFGKNQF
ncbi:hypothetical protein F511_39546 [Dorcoceras hygrometricum]|uniref:Uncharacterized protein n=1 Tax=Dorcoceras hygrometricum TaxID=472368 RepID=A0A2Z7BVD2_9LAMI|nr:hypothetical protein F511_39546 [Dorcoceras hygrometricum]